MKIPKYSKWDYAINLIDEVTPMFYKIYSLLPMELDALREYLNNMLCKGYIRPLISKAGYPVIFIPKKNGKLQLVVDYYRLNAITKKDWMPLPLIEELRDRLIGKQYFTILNLKGAYNLIRIKEGDE